MSYKEAYNQWEYDPSKDKRESINSQAEQINQVCELEFALSAIISTINSRGCGGLLVNEIKRLARQALNAKVKDALQSAENQEQMSDYNTIRLRQVARLKIAQNQELTKEEEFALTDFVPSKMNIDGKPRKEKAVRPTRSKKLDGMGEIIDELRSSGMSKSAIARKLKVSTTNVCDNLKRRGKV